MTYREIMYCIYPKFLILRHKMYVGDLSTRPHCFTPREEPSHHFMGDRVVHKDVLDSATKTFFPHRPRIKPEPPVLQPVYQPL
jgi:hypothetical protein